MVRRSGVVSTKRRHSAQKHGTYGHTCSICGVRIFGNGGWSSHKRKHVRAWVGGESMLALTDDQQKTLQAWIRRYECGVRRP